MKKKHGGNGGHGGKKVNGKSRTLDERFDDMDKRFDTIEKILKAHSSDIRNIKNGVAHLRARMDSMEQKYDARFKRIEDHLGIGPPPES